ncbi:MAG TPA: PfkB family carbohydrate kinase [Candidatus Eisenbacteria bacterium]|jgi:rfaE bifunctional protein kinase chain/domain|nr:PfkB family carbohydrate kinase [Candidatus Eisenbacteria bacterium]
MSAAKKSLADGSVDLLALAEIVERFAGKRIVLFGDFVADEFQFGDISRVSREAPVLILRHRETRVVPGGGANAANNLAALGAQVSPVTVIGDDTVGEALAKQFCENGIETSGIVRAKNWNTPTKTRFLAGWAHTVAQQVLRVDREPGCAPPDSTLAKVAAKLQRKLGKADGLAISDYGFGVASPVAVSNAIRSEKRKIPVTLDARYRLDAYAGSGITAATPNEAELEALHHTTIGRNLGELEKRGLTTLKQMNLHSLLVTRGKDGMALFEREGKKVSHIPVHGSDQAVDVTGAGDTVLAAYTLALVCGASSFEAAHIANIAGGLVVMKRGTAVVTSGELLTAIRGEVSGSAA